MKVEILVTFPWCTRVIQSLLVALLVVRAVGQAVVAGFHSVTVQVLGVVVVDGVSLLVEGCS
jgi:hypothetical protein